ncbi:hypothetical protein L6164_034641 [Bauhinia variegata]|uniref:Uncharacterized protein n=1 Tax=Bauhinia variegata TaxID=167791 RepID=A0ACB9KVS0_BAUVA|nr:hypothetical protein L6164_034641 [Bauhinia variegata]
MVGDELLRNRILPHQTIMTSSKDPSESKDDADILPIEEAKRLKSETKKRITKKRTSREARSRSLPLRYNISPITSFHWSSINGFLSR